MKIHSDIIAKKEGGRKMLSVLIDPDKTGDEKYMMNFLKNCENAKVDYIFFGGSLLTETKMDHSIRFIKENCRLPVILFPGDVMQVHPSADALLFLSLISGRNADLLIGKHVTVAPIIKQIGIETLSTGYMLIDCGKPTTASYISQTLPIPYEKPEIAAVTAMAGEMMGMKMIYADGGSGAEKPIDEKMISAIKKNISVPLVVGGGIRDLNSAEKVWNAGADMVVIGTAFEKNPASILEFSNRQ